MGENNLWLLNNEEMEDCSKKNKFKENLSKSFVINLTSFDSQEARDLSEIILPIATNYEIDGSFVNCFGIWQNFKSSVPLLEKSKKGWKEIKVLIQKKDCKETKFKVFLPGKIKQERKDNIFYFNLINNIYNSDNIVRRATSLQKTSDAKNKDFLFISEEYAKKNHLESYDKVKLFSNNKEYQL